jgi:polysaccharide export outer membrane protein
MGNVNVHQLASMTLTAILLVSSEVWAQTAPPESARIQGTAPILAIGPGDTVEITVYDVPELTLKVRVSEDGSVNLPLVGAMHWAGLSAAEAEHLLAATLVREDYVKKPQVSIFVKEFVSQGVSVLGEVKQPGIYPLLGPHTLGDAIGAAGGLTPTAGNAIQIAHKGAPEAQETVIVRSDGTFENAPTRIQPGDMITVSKAGFVYVVGAVNNPGGFLIDNSTHMTVVKAIALARGQTERAKMSHVSIVRQKGGPPEVTTIDLKRTMRGLTGDIGLQADDIVYVPNSVVRTTADIVQKATVGAAAAAVLVWEGH